MATQVERDEPELRGAVAAAAEVSELRATRDAVGREHAAAMAAHGQESATLHDEHARSVHEQGVARAQLEADHAAHEVDRSALDGRVASLQQQVAQLELERREGAVRGARAVAAGQAPLLTIPRGAGRLGRAAAQ